MAATLTINGTDILRYVEHGGLKYSENDIDSPDAGRTLDAVMHRGKVTQKRKIELKLCPMTSALKDKIFDIVSKEYVNVRYNNTKSKDSWSATMYNSSRSATLAFVNSDGIEIWDEISFNLIER